MGSSSSSSWRRVFRCLLLPLLFLSLYWPAPASAANKSYVVYMGSHEHNHSKYPEETSAVRTQRVADAHYKFLGSFLGSKEKARDAIFYSYCNFINGFAADLDEADAAAIAKSPEVLAVFPNEAKKLHTTRSWEFLGLEKAGQVPSDSPWIKARFGKDTIIGNLDTGVWPERQSFNDAGLGPVPSRWKGTCESGSQNYAIRCNRKLIGARYLSKGYEAYFGKTNALLYGPRDDNGHGSHTLSTAAGRFVPRASLFGYGNGTAKGGSPGARVAAYKVCWPSVNGVVCFDADILAAFDAAVDDGVDVLSVSLGGSPSDYFSDGLAIGSFHAVRKGITVVCSAGNSGPSPGTVSNVAPWMITVGASTMDRKFPSYAILGSGKHLKGQSLSQLKLPAGRFYPLISSSAAPAIGYTESNAQVCLLGSLDPAMVKGKIVVCLRGTNGRMEKGQAVLQAGGVGMILANDETTLNEVVADPHVLPATHLSYQDGLEVFAYITSDKNPRAEITTPKTVLGYKPAPAMATFSSRGPNVVTPEILKPDITAPGVSVLAAFTNAVGPSTLPSDNRRVPFTSMSGTSMSCPHVAGIAGLLKTLHYKWSPAAIRSAIMTSATTLDNTDKAIRDSNFVKATPFSYGSGHLRPTRAVDPGLVYDIATNDYLNFLCSLGYTSDQVATFSVVPYTCPPNPPSVLDLNYPSITVPYLSAQKVTVARRLTNVGAPGTYRVTVVPPPGVSVTVSPAKLRFGKVGEVKGFRVILQETKTPDGSYVYGSLTWSDGVHDVRSPIVVKPT